MRRIFFTLGIGALFIALSSSMTGFAQQPPPPQGEERRQQERSFLPEVTEVQRWLQVGIVGERDNFAPSIVSRYEGGYRMYWNAAVAGGVASAVSSDGLTWETESGLRLVNGGAGALDCIASHVWVIQVEGGYRMFYHGNANCETPSPNRQTPPEYRVMSAFSEDGLTFEKEGVRVDIGEGTGLTQAGHGRILMLPDGTYRMYFSANFIGRQGPADILGASSVDTLTWTLDETVILERGHDPTVIQIGETIYLYTTFLGDNFVVMESEDGYTFTPTHWLEFYDENGARIEEFGDADLLLTPDGTLYLYGTGKGAQGIGIFVREESE